MDSIIILMLQFKYAVRQILLKNAIGTSINSNINVLDNDAIGSIFLIKWSTKKHSSENETDMTEEMIDQHSIQKCVISKNSELKHYILHYISGYIVRKMLDRIECNSCRQSLLANNHYDMSYFPIFTSSVNNGGLIYPSTDVVKIVEYTENELLIRTNHFTMLHAKNLYENTIMYVKHHFALEKAIFSDLNCDTFHFDRAHKLQLIASIAHKFINIRLLSFGKFYTNEILLPLRRRHKLTKLILFGAE